MSFKHEPTEGQIGRTDGTDQMDGQTDGIDGRTPARSGMDGNAAWVSVVVVYGYDRCYLWV